MSTGPTTRCRARGETDDVLQPVWRPGKRPLPVPGRLCMQMLRPPGELPMVGSLHDRDYHMGGNGNNVAAVDTSMVTQVWYTARQLNIGPQDHCICFDPIVWGHCMNCIVMRAIPVWHPPWLHSGMADMYHDALADRVKGRRIYPSGW